VRSFYRSHTYLQTERDLVHSEHSIARICDHGFSGERVEQFAPDEPRHAGDVVHREV